jgi:hypothetical protein
MLQKDQAHKNSNLSTITYFHNLKHNHHIRIAILFGLISLLLLQPSKTNSILQPSNQSKKIYILVIAVIGHQSQITVWHLMKIHRILKLL